MGMGNRMLGVKPKQSKSAASTTNKPSLEDHHQRLARIEKHLSEKQYKPLEPMQEKKPIEKMPEKSSSGIFSGEEDSRPGFKPSIFP